MRGAYKIISVKGIGIFIHWTFVFLILWLLFINATRGGTAENFLWSVIFILTIFFCVVLHELGHALVALRFGIKTKNITLLPIGGIANIEKMPEKAGQELAIAIAGPLVNVVIALLLIPFVPSFASMAKLSEGTLFVSPENFLFHLQLINIWLVVFNLIPAFPMDGGRILRSLLALKLDRVKATIIAASVGKIIAVLFIIGGIFTFNLFLSIIGLFIIFSASAEEYFLRLKSLIRGVRLKDVVMRDYNSLPANSSVQDVSKELMSVFTKYFVVLDGEKPIGTVSRNELVHAISEDRSNVLVKNLISKKVTPLDGEKEVERVLEKLAENNEQIHPVLEDGQFTGVVSLQNIIEYILINKNLKGYRKKALSGMIR